MKATQISSVIRSVRRMLEVSVGSVVLLCLRCCISLNIMTLQISDAVLDACLEQDPDSKVRDACDTVPTYVSAEYTNDGGSLAASTKLADDFTLSWEICVMRSTKLQRYLANRQPCQIL
jgi:hypothetical protein